MRCSALSCSPDSTPPGDATRWMKFGWGSQVSCSKTERGEWNAWQLRALKFTCDCSVSVSVFRGSLQPRTITHGLDTRGVEYSVFPLATEKVEKVPRSNFENSPATRWIFDIGETSACETADQNGFRDNFGCANKTGNNSRIYGTRNRSGHDRLSF